MGFTDPVVGGVTLIRSAIQSADYAAGVSGWKISRDGTAEFNNTTIRGSLRITDPDGSFLYLHDDDPGVGVTAEFHPAPIGGQNVQSGFLTVSSAPAGPEDQVQLQLIGPTLDTGQTPASVEITYRDASGAYIVITGDTVEIAGALVMDAVYQFHGQEQMVSAAAVTAGTNTTAPDGVIRDMGGTGSQTSVTFQKKHTYTRVKIHLQGTCFATNTTTSINFYVRVQGTDYQVTAMAAAIGTERISFSGFLIIPAGLPAILDFPQARWSCTGVGTATRNTGDWLTLSVQEVP
jgi:hypothetical protein